MKDLLKKYFGYDEFRPMQKDIIENTFQKKDSLVIMPTGAGKSLCYQIPALKFDGLTLVISPLISLMKDQVDGLKTNGINAEFINSSLSEYELADIKRRIHENKVKILYIAPERFALEDFKIFLATLQISLIAIDEAHCISEWGHDFRPDYRNLRFLKNFFPDVPIIALTATATEKVREDILLQLSLKNPQIFISSFNRENLNLIVLKKKNTFNKILNLLKKHRNESVIIYCFSRKDSENIAERLRENGFNALPYHAGLNNETRKQNQELFIKDKVNIIVATIAFGMGINKPDVRMIIHHTFPKSLEGYYQEIGRAGRDGLPSDCIMFYSFGDKRKHEFFIDKITEETVKFNAKEKLNKIIKYCENKSCRRKYILNYFGEIFPEENCNGCDICLNLSETEENIKKEKFDRKTEGKLNYDKTLFEKLRNLRKQIANERNVPPFIIFGDVSLREMAFHLPTNRQEFLNITGVGERKLEDFGDLFIETIKDYAEANNIASNNIIMKHYRKKERPRHLSERYQRTKELILRKLPISEISKEQELTTGTIIKHIEKLIGGEEKIDIYYLLPKKEILDKIISAFETFGTERLAPIYDYFNGGFSYDELRLVRCFMKLNQDNLKGKNFQSDYRERLEQIKEKFPNAYEPWSEKEDNLLRKLFSDSKKVIEISQILKRQPSAIRSRLKKPGLIAQSKNLKSLIS